MANVGDTRAYFIRQKTIRRLSVDHVATSVPVKLRLMLELPGDGQSRSEASDGAERRPAEPFCQPDFATQFLHHGDFILRCTNGLHALCSMRRCARSSPATIPYDACKELVALAEKRGSDDNISLQT